YLAKAATQANGMLPQVPVNLVMDTTCFGRKWGVMVLYDACSKRALTVWQLSGKPMRFTCRRSLHYEKKVS
ncbi:hypothetical protein, partial [Cardiobacterium valvarum]